MFGSGSSLTRSASFSQPPANKPFSGSGGGFTFGGGSSTATPAPASNTAQIGAPAAGGFSFGSKPNTTTGGLFGSTAPAQNGGLFGNSQSQQQQQQQQQQQSNSAGGGLFSKPATGGFSFGASSTAPSTGLFGSSTNNASTAGGLGSNMNPTSAAGGFGSSTNTAGTTGGFGGLGGGLFGASSASTQPQQANQQPFQQQQHQQQQQQSASPFLRFSYYQKERFNDLPEDAKRLVEELDRYVGAQTQVRDELKTKDFGAEIRRCAAEWQQLDSALKSLSATLDSDFKQAKDVAQRLEQDRADNSTLYAIAANAKEGRSDGSAFADWLRTYFQNLAVEYRNRISRYRNTMDTVQRHLQSLDSKETYTPQAISDVIHAQHASFMALAADVASLHSEIESLKKDYAKWYKQTHKSVRDPFASMLQLAGSVPQ